jgi:hypothetical protein
VLKRQCLKKKRGEGVRGLKQSRNMKWRTKPTVSKQKKETELGRERAIQTVQKKRVWSTEGQ